MAKKTAPPLGELEIAVLERLWRVGDLTAKEAHEALGRARGISLNTVQSALDRLHRKQILTRKKEARAYRYAPRVAREALLAELIGDLVGRLGGGEPASSLAAFVSAAEHLDASALAELERLIGERRQTQEGGDQQRDVMAVFANGSPLATRGATDAGLLHFVRNHNLTLK